MHSLRFPSIPVRIAVAAALATACSLPLRAAELPNGVAAGDVTQDAAVLWARSLNTGTLTFDLASDPGFTSVINSIGTSVTDPWQPVKATLSGLSSATTYYYRATDSLGNVSTGTFATAAAGGFNGLRFGVSGDWRGELAPYPAISNVAGRSLNFFAEMGDSIYADYPSPNLNIPQATTLAEFRVKQEETMALRGGVNTWKDLRQSTAMLATIDDHEVTNDFAGAALASSDPRFAGSPPGTLINQTPLYRNGLQAFHEYMPIQSQTYSGTGDASVDGAPKLYRNQTYGKDATVIMLDARSFRDTELPAADPTNPASIGAFLAASFDPNRTLLGKPQLADLKNDLLAAQSGGVRWKFVMLPEPIQNLGVLAASDRYEGYAAERTELLKFINDNNIQNVVFVSADIHGTLVNNLTFQESLGGPQIATNAWEITTGPVAFDAPFGPTVAEIAAGLGLPGTLPLAVYNALTPAQQEAYIQGLVNAQIQPLGYDPLGLQGSGIPYELLAGGFTDTNSYGWTEFDIDPVSGKLLVTTYGLRYYDVAAALADPDAIAALSPMVLSQFSVMPVPEPSTYALMLAGLLGVGAVARRRRR